MKNTKSAYVGVRLFPEDFERVNATAASLGVSPSRLVRLLIHYTAPNLGPSGQSTHFRSWVRRVLTRPLFG